MGAARTHAVHDSASVERQRKQALIEAERQVQKDLFVEQVSKGRYVREDKLDDWEHQAGRRLVSSVFEAKLLKLLPALQFYTTPMPEHFAQQVGLAGTNQLMRSARYPCADDPRGMYCGAWLYPIANEFDLLILKRVVTPIVDPKTGFLADTIEDIPDPKKYNLSEFVSEGDEVALTNVEEYTWKENARIPGWRSPLVWIVRAGLLTPAQVERFFEPADRASWAVHMGRRGADLVTI